MADDEGLNLDKPAREITRGILRVFWDWITGRGRTPEATTAPKRGILILGPGGAGKSTLARLLAGDPDWMETPPGKYVESADLEHVVLQDDPDVEVVVAPGQVHRRPST